MSDLVKVATTTTPELLAKIRAAGLALDPNAKGKITFSVDHYGNMAASVGVRGKVGSKVTVSLSAYGVSGGGGRVGGAEGTISWDPEP